MIRFVLPIIFVVISIGLFFSYISPGYEEVKRLQAEEARFDEALEKVKELEQIKEELLTKYNGLSSEELDRLQKLLPDNVDNVRLILDLAGIASERNVRIGSVTIEEPENEAENGAVGGAASENTLGSIRLSFSASAVYDDLVLFLKDVEKSLRIVDVTGISFGGQQDEQGSIFGGSGVTNYTINIVTYWLK